MSRRNQAVSRARRSSLLITLCLIVSVLLSSCQRYDSSSNQGSAQHTTSPAQAQPDSSANRSAKTVALDGRETEPANTEAYSHLDENPFLEVARAPLSTFSVDVDTASYSNTRRFLNNGQLPPKDAVRIEELINYFSYDYPQPVGTSPFSVMAEVSECPWNMSHRLVHIGLQGKRLEAENVPARNLVFLLDVSGSMNDPRKLPLLKSALAFLVEQLNARDRVAIVVYAGSSGLVLPATSGDRKGEILAALGQLEAGGSTNGGQGITLAYQIAQENFIRDGVNRVILATDGDFNVGVTNEGDLVRLIEEKRRGGVFLTVLGFGTGNLKDATMEKLADKGNGNYAYIDSLEEARKVFGNEVGATLVTIAKDVKIQVEFNPKQVAGYRLIGYENRLLRDEDFNDDQKNAGDIGAGHTVTALYEIVPFGQKVENHGSDPLKYQTQPVPSESAASHEMMTVKLRYKEPNETESRLLSVGVVDAKGTLGEASANLKFSSAVAAFGMLLRDSKHKGNARYDAVLRLARASLGTDLHGYRAEFIKLVETAETLSTQQQARN
jgi:Ca-activated chloride channel family protein